MSESMRSILLVDGNREAREGLAVMLRKHIGCVVLETPGPAEAIEILVEQEISLVITDLFAPKQAGIELLKQIRSQHPQVAVIVSVPYGDRDSVVEALRRGAIFYIHSPYDFEEAVIATARALEHHELLVHQQKRSPKISKNDGFQGIIGQASKMRDLFRNLEKVAEDGESNVLIHGESGTGKELVARATHALSPRKGKNFVPVNCAAIPDELLESELFGYVKGAFTGANQSKMGRIQYADGGTLFLDEIGDMKPSLQAKLLRVIQEREFEPVGGVKPVSVNVRIVAATHRDLEAGVAEGRFREDLFYRLSVVPLHIPPLRERTDDIPVLIEKFVQVFNRGRKNGLKGFAPNAIAALLEYQWPGNVRELENLVQRMSILFAGEVVTASDLPEKYQRTGDIQVKEEPVVSTEVTSDEAPGTENFDFNALVSDFEDRLILKALTKTGGNKKEAAKLLNLKRTTLIEKIKKKQLEGSVPPESLP
ncbi:MAG: sigma-54-dependent Fis family transcriptional regulator [Desulfuromonadaceae bacterium GWC2_58_13]|nr:MAG: sigma-54-dependent Fis family transcriptional regulator [Desulfuromonadaceae bacterium GWC2_58_13]